MRGGGWTHQTPPLAMPLMMMMMMKMMMTAYRQKGRETDLSTCECRWSQHRLVQWGQPRYKSWLLSLAGSDWLHELDSQNWCHTSLWDQQTNKHNCQLSLACIPITHRCHSHAADVRQESSSSIHWRGDFSCSAEDETSDSPRLRQHPCGIPEEPGSNSSHLVVQIFLQNHGYTFHPEDLEKGQGDSRWKTW